MLPPMLPLSAVPITSQHDPVRPRPDIAPVVPMQESASDSTIDLQPVSYTHLTLPTTPYV